MSRARSVARACVLAASWAALLAPASGCDALRPTKDCRLGDEQLVQLTASKEIDAIALAALGSRSFAFWSEPAGAFGRVLNAQAKPVGPIAALGERCAGGLAAASVPSAGAIVLACSTRAHAGSAGALRVVWLDRALGITRARELEPVGPQSDGVDVAIASGNVQLVWQDGSAELQRVMRAALAPDASVIEPPRALSDPSRIASAPAIAVQARRSVAVWSERYMDGEALRTTIVRWDERSGLRTLLAQAHVSAMPQLVALDGRLALAVRDRPRDAKIGLYLAFVGEQAVRGADLIRVGRADGVGRPALEPCMDGLVSATPRTYGGDYFIGFNWLDRSLRRARGEQQFYEDSHAFTQVAATCLGTHAVLLIAEFPQLHRDTAALRALPYVCE